MEKLAFNIVDAFNSPFGKEKTIGDVISLIVTSSIVISSTMLLFFFVIAGISIISGAGESNPEKIAKGKKAATSALIGFFIVFVAYWIIRIIELITGQDFITAPGL